MTANPNSSAQGVAIFGGTSLDLVARTESAALVGVSNPGSVKRLAGGVGLNVATILARLGTRTRLISKVGDDAEGLQILAAADAAGVNVSGISAATNQSTASYCATFDERGNLIIGVADMRVLAEITPEHVARHIPPNQPPHECFWVLDANLPEETIAFLAGAATRLSVPLAVLTVSPAKAVRLRPILNDATLVFTNIREAAALLGHDPGAENLCSSSLAAELASGRRTTVIVTDAAAPLAVATGDSVRTFETLSADVRAVNGAGDSFAAGVLHALAAGINLDAAIQRGLKAAQMTLEAGSITDAPFAPGALASPGDKS